MKRIAIIEDDAAISQMYRMKFEVEGYEVETADNGKTGVELVREFQPDIVLMDLMMPEMNGDEALQEIRNQDWGKDIKVIILTNLGKQEAPTELDGLNVSEYVVKAEMTPKQVAELVEKTLS